MARQDIRTADLVRDAEDIFWRLSEHGLQTELDDAVETYPDAASTRELYDLVNKADSIVDALESVFNSTD